MGVLSDGKKKLKLFIKTEEETATQNVAKYPVQRGQPIIDHTQADSKTWNFEGWIQGKDQKTIDATYQQLLSWQFYGNLLTWNGAVHHPNMIISELHKSYDNGGMKNALAITISLTWVNLVKSSKSTAKKSQGPKSPVKKKSAPKKGTYMTVRAGNTYWAWSQKYGVSVAQLRKWNKWPDRKIPVGAKVRVK